MPRRKQNRRKPKGKVSGKPSPSSSTSAPSSPQSTAQAPFAPSVSPNPLPGHSTGPTPLIPAVEDTAADLHARATEVLERRDVLRKDLDRKPVVAAKDPLVEQAAESSDQAKALDTVAKEISGVTITTAAGSAKDTQDPGQNVPRAVQAQAKEPSKPATQCSQSEKVTGSSNSRHGPITTDDRTKAFEWRLTSEARAAAGHNEENEEPFVFGPGATYTEHEIPSDADSNETIELFCGGSLDPSVLDPKGVCRSWMRRFLIFDPDKNIDLAELDVAIKQAFEWRGRHFQLDNRQMKALVMDKEAIPEAKTYQLCPHNFIMPAVRWTKLPSGKRICRMPYQEIPMQVIGEALKLSGVTPTATARMFIRIVTVRDEGAVLWPFSLWFYYVDTFSKFYGEDFPLLDEKEFYDCLLKVYEREGRSFEGWMITNECAYFEGIAPRIPIGKAEDLKAAYQKAKYERYLRNGNLPAKPKTPFAAALRKNPLVPRSSRAPDIWANKIRRADAYTEGRVAGEAELRKQEAEAKAAEEAVKKGLDNLSKPRPCKCSSDGGKHLPTCEETAAMTKIANTWGYDVLERVLLQRLDEAAKDPKDVKRFASLLHRLDFAQGEARKLEQEYVRQVAGTRWKGKGKAMGPVSEERRGTKTMISPLEDLA